MTDGVNGATSTSSNIANAQNSLAGDQQTFLKLLTTQLKNQDPLSPMDTNQFTQQLVAMTGVQQQILSNQLLQQIVSGQGGVGDAVNLIGKTVTAANANSTLASGKADWTYNLAAGAANVTLQVYDSLGRVVSESKLTNVKAGDQSFSWNGKNASGVQQADGGVYTLKITPTDASGGAIPSNVFSAGLVTSVDMADGDRTVTVGGVKIPVSSITSVQAAS